MSFLRSMFAATKADPVAEVLARLLGHREFTWEFVPVLGLGRIYEVRSQGQSLYLTILPYGETCADRLATVERRLRAGDVAPQILATKDCEPLLDGHAIVLSDAMLARPLPIGE